MAAGAQARLAADLGASLARTRTAWDAATLRGDAAVQAGDRAAVTRALDEQRALLRELHEQVDSVIGRAAVEREAEAIVAGAAQQAHPRRERATGRRRAAGAVAGALVAGIVGLLAVTADTGPRVPDVAPLADGSEVTVASERIQPLEVAFDRVADVLTELRAALTGAPHASAAGLPDDRPADEPAPASDEPAAAAGEPVAAAPEDDGAVSVPDHAVHEHTEGLLDGAVPDDAEDGDDEDDEGSPLDRLRDRLEEGGPGLFGDLGEGGSSSR